MPDHIQIGDQKPWVQYSVDEPNQGQPFSYPFPIFQEEDLEVYVDNELQTLETDYTVDGAGDTAGGTVTFLTLPPIGSTVTLRRRLTIQRTSDFQESGEFRAKVLNDELDYQTAAIQQVADDVTRVLSLPATDPEAGLVLPEKDLRKNGFLGFDENGTPVAMAGVTDVPVSVFMGGVLDDTDVGELMTTMTLTPVDESFIAGTDGDGDASDPFELNYTPSSPVDVFVWLNNVPQLANWAIADRDFHFDFTPMAGDGVRIRYRTGDI